MPLETSAPERRAGEAYGRRHTGRVRFAARAAFRVAGAQEGRRLDAVEQRRYDGGSTMLARVDRVQLAVSERRSAAAGFRQLLGAEIASEDAVAPLAARRTTLRAGTAAIELLEPDGAGPLATHLGRSGPGMFAAGFATVDVGALRERLLAQHVAFAEAGEQLLLASDATGDHGLRCVISPLLETRPAPGMIDHLYEVTNLVADHAAATALYAERFGLAPGRFCPIDSAHFGYRGVLTMFSPDERLDRIECITPYDHQKTMGRYMRTRGECLYMCFAEAPDLAPICARLAAHAPNDWSAASAGDVPDTLFIHPKALSGMMMGISRTSVGWTWSGHPERVTPRPWR